MHITSISQKMHKPFIIGIGAHTALSQDILAAAIIRHLSRIRYPSGKACLAQSNTQEQSFMLPLSKTKPLSNRKTKIRRVCPPLEPKSSLVKSPREELEERSHLPFPSSRPRCIVIEGNSAIEFVKPDIVIFIFGSRKKTPRFPRKRLCDRPISSSLRRRYPHHSNRYK